MSSDIKARVAVEDSNPPKQSGADTRGVAQPRTLTPAAAPTSISFILISFLTPGSCEIRLPSQFHKFSGTPMRVIDKQE
jgi:hypothetical protein